MRDLSNISVGRFLRLIRFSHTVFALPFALGALIVAADGWPPLRVLLLVIACMVLARTAAMLFNRLVDWSVDQRNPRTATRHLLIAKSSAWILLTLSVAGFDLIYATQDYDFDRREGLHSLVVTLGVARSLHIAQWLHVLMFGVLIA